MQYLTIIGFFVLLIILNFLRSQIAKQIQIISVLLFNNYKPGIIFYSLFFLPGVIIHELSHLIAASLLGVATGEIHIFPREIKPGNIKMGSVQSAESDPIRETLIGSAPMLFGIAIITFIILFQFNDQNIVFNIQNVIYLYLIYTISNTMFVSGEDMRSFWVIPLLIIVIASFIFAFSINFSSAINYLHDYMLLAVKAFAICGAIDLLSISLIMTTKYLAENITGRRLINIK